MQSNVSAGVTRVPQHLADGLFSALGRGAVDAAELAILGSSAEQSVGQVLASQMSAAGSAQANLDRLLWESEDSSWQDGKSRLALITRFSSPPRLHIRDHLLLLDAISTDRLMISESDWDEHR